MGNSFLPFPPEDSTMARKYTFTDSRTSKVLFETIQENYISEDEVHKMFKRRTGRDYRLEKGIIDCQIRTVED